MQGSTGGKEVANAAELFAGPMFENQLGISGKTEVTVEQPKWIKKEGHTNRTPGSGSTTDWTVTFQPNGFTFTDANSLTLHDQLPNGSTLVEGSVKVDNAPVTPEVTPGADSEGQSFTISGLMTDNRPVTIAYQTHVEEDMYENGTGLGNNVAWFTFTYGGVPYETPKVETPVGSGDGSGTPGTATLVKTNTGYNAAKRAIDWEVTINHHKANLKSGTFIDDLSGEGPQCAEHKSGLEVDEEKGIVVLVDDVPLADGNTSVEVMYSNQKITVKTNNVGPKAITLKYTTKVCDPCVFANNTTAAFKNVISTTDMSIGNQTNLSRSAESTVGVNPTVMTKKAPVYDYAAGRMKWTVEVDGAGLSMKDVVLTDTLPEGLTYVDGTFSAAPAIEGAHAASQGQTLTITLGEVTQKTTVTFETAVDPEVLGFAGAQPVVVENTIGINGEAGGYGNSVHFAGGSVLLGGEKKNSAAVAGGDAGNADANIPQTGDDTRLLIAATVLTGVLLAAMTVYRILRVKRRESE